MQWFSSQNCNDFLGGGLRFSQRKAVRPTGIDNGNMPTNAGTLHLRWQSSASVAMQWCTFYWTFSRSSSGCHHAFSVRPRPSFSVPSSCKRYPITQTMNGHLHALQQRFAITCVWLVSGVYDLEPISRTYVNEPLKLTAREIEDCSPINLVEALVKNLLKAPNTTLTIVFGQYDPPVFREQSEKYHREIKEKLKPRRGTSDDQAFKLAEPLEIPDRDHFTVVDQLHNSVLLKDIQRCILQEGRLTRTIGLKPQAMPRESINLDQIDYSSLVQS
ncbi:hypothetical protein RvY_17793-1 [Ramazzottius varieornatus]|uniref:Uncharacterized protein n=1 Tax=Ramazzottius varieornatus TaxID=947166 RepID=A0A1D1W3F6_RAMVA|nr:hypothetical protein RvY_17793-1 [Ramazzottius varieornatus]